jgi:hypothetical protein
VRLAEVRAEQALTAVSDSGRLMVRMVPATADELEDHAYLATMIRRVLDRLHGEAGKPSAVIRVTGAGRALTVSPDAFVAWLERTNCPSCGLSIGMPRTDAPAEVFAEARFR